MPAMPLQAMSLLFHAYVGWRLVPALGSLPEQVALVLLLLVSALTLPFGLGARRGGKRRFAAELAWIGLVCMGFFSSLFVLTFARDLGLLAVAALDAMRPGALALAPLLTPSARVVPIAALLVTLWGFVNARRTARVVHVDIPVAGLPPALDGFTIAQISDVHVGPTIKRPYVEAIVDAVNRQEGRPCRRHRRPGRRLGARPGRARRSARRPALEGRQLLRHRQPRVLLGCRRLGRASCAASAWWR